MYISTRFWTIVFLAVVVLAPSAQAQSGVVRFSFAAGPEASLTIEILDDDLARFEYASAPLDGPIAASPMVAKTNYDGPSAVSTPAPNVIETPDLRLIVDESTLCVTANDLTRSPALTLTTVCPAEGEANALTFTAESTTDIYGLGEQFQRRGGPDGNWFGKRRVSLNAFGNALERFEGGNVGSAQFPVVYALGEGSDNYALFLDDVHQQLWNFSADPFYVETTADALRWYLMTGPDLPDLRADYLELTGRPPVPPKQMFGLWVSEYGYDDWAELDGVLQSMREANFPLDGFFLDLQWFGGIDAPSHMGWLAWDTENFPDPAAKIAQLRDDYGLGVAVIEEPYVDRSTPDYADLLARGVLVRECAESTCEVARVRGWWGDGGMIDWTDRDGAAYWHDQRRLPLIEDGVMAHWTDLGEPEIFDPSAYYHGVEDDRHDHADIHNLYNLLWSRSVFDGYARTAPDQRPFILSRSGTSGSQRFGVAMWSGDIAANMPSMATHLNAQMHMSLSGVDYFGADVGGFYRQAFDPVLRADGIYTLWLANAALTDVPLRPHTANQQNLYDTAPSLIGDVASNLANIRLRYMLTPYLYTLAHRAYRTGEAVFPPLVYAFQDDPNVRLNGSQKLIGDALMTASVTGYSTQTHSVYLPAGLWFNVYTGEAIESAGESVSLPIGTDGLVHAPLLARDGAIIPLLPVDEHTLNALGLRADGTTSSDLVIVVYAGHATSSAFTLIEDDGWSTAYQAGALRETPISFDTAGDGTVSVTVGPASGAYDGAPDSRQIEVRLITPDGVSIRRAEVTAADGFSFIFED
jgi:alpha-glucosidase (family GH31 glycosyl hydrolase)